MMDSSFLTLINVALGLFAVYSFFKLIIRFGLPNHPGRLTIYIVTFCAAIYFAMKSTVGLGFVSPFVWLRWRTLPMVAGSLALLLQVFSTAGQISNMQQKVVSRLPLIAGLLFFVFFPDYADYFFMGTVVAGGAFLSISVGKVRHQKRLFFKMCLFLVLFQVMRAFNIYWIFVLGETLLLVAMFYFFLFEESLGVKTIIEDRSHNEGMTA
ncbi:MAG: hypothetical protein V4598_16760 [Bdellovibrionota bacterium]